MQAIKTCINGQKCNSTPNAYCILLPHTHTLHLTFPGVKMIYYKIVGFTGLSETFCSNDCCRQGSFSVGSSREQTNGGGGGGVVKGMNELRSFTVGCT